MKRTARVAALLAICCATACGRDLPPGSQVILLSLDTLRADRVGVYGYERETTPHLDVLAGRSVLFEDAVAQASFTRWSHMSLFKSRLPSHIGRGEPRLAQVFADNGFTTAAFTGGGNVSSKLGFDAGFELYEEEPDGFAESMPRILAWLRAHADERFFLFLHSYDIHVPYDPPPPFDDAFLPEYTGDLRGEDTLALTAAARRKPSESRARRSVSAADRERVEALYDGGVRYADEFVGELTRLLDELGLLPGGTLVVVSDHGEEFWEHGSVLHSQTLYEEVIRVPLLVHLPGGEFAGRRVRPTVRLLDVGPTLLELAGLPVPDTFEGRSLLPLIRGDVQRMPPAVSEIVGVRTVIDRPWKLIQSHGPNVHIRALYHLVRDPGELDDLSAEEPGRYDALEEELARTIGEPVGGAPEPMDVPGADPELTEQLRALGYLEE